MILNSADEVFKYQDRYKYQNRVEFLKYVDTIPYYLKLKPSHLYNEKASKYPRLKFFRQK